MNRQELADHLANLARLHEVAERVNRSTLSSDEGPGLYPDTLVAAERTEAAIRKAVADAPVDKYQRARVLVALDTIIAAAEAAARGRILRDACDLIGDENGGIKLEAPGARPALYLRDVVDSSNETRAAITRDIRAHDSTIVRESGHIVDTLAAAHAQADTTS